MWVIRPNRQRTKVPHAPRLYNLLCCSWGLCASHLCWPSPPSPPHSLSLPLHVLLPRYVRNTTARAFSVVASALGIPALLPFLKAVCMSKKSWQVGLSFISGD